jgi:chromosome segregation ATPase
MERVVDAMQNRVDELEVKLRLADFASRAAKREATEMATWREREAAKARTPPASPLRTSSRASPLKSPPRSPGESLLSLVASTFEREAGGAGTPAAAETEALRARVAMLESDLAARDARVETAESDVRRATRAVRELSARAERRNRERREAAAAEMAASAAAAKAARDENVALRRRVDELETERRREQLLSKPDDETASDETASPSRVVSRLEKELADRDARLAVAESDLRQATSSVAELTVRISERDTRAREARAARENELVAQLAASDAQMERILEATELRETALRAELDEAKLREARAAARLQAFEETKREKDAETESRARRRG